MEYVEYVVERFKYEVGGSDGDGDGDGNGDDGPLEECALKEHVVAGIADGGGDGDVADGECVNVDGGFNDGKNSFLIFAIEFRFFKTLKEETDVSCCWLNGCCLL